MSDKPHDGLQLLYASAKQSGLQTRVLGLGTQQKVGHGSGGFGLKLSALKEALLELEPSQYVLFTDAYDVLLQGSTEPLESWLDTHQNVLFAAETVNWPDPTLKYPQGDGFILHLNSGVFAGRAAHILELLQTPFSSTTDDQFYYASQYVTGKTRIILDSTATHFLCVHKAPGTIQLQRPVRFIPKYYPATTPLVLHLNNGLTRIYWFEALAPLVLGEWSRQTARNAAWSGLFFKGWFAKRHTLAVWLLVILVTMSFITYQAPLYLEARPSSVLRGAAF